MLTDEIISEFLLPRTLCYDYIWSRVWMALAVGFDLGRGTVNLGKPVAKLDGNDKILQVYSSMSEAARDVGIDKGGISKVCLGKKERAAGHKWRFVDSNDYYKHRRI